MICLLAVVDFYNYDPEFSRAEGKKEGKTSIPATYLPQNESNSTEYLCSVSTFFLRSSQHLPNARTGIYIHPEINI